MFCKKCGFQLPDDTKYCPKCGEKVNGTVVDVPPTVSPQNSSINNVNRINNQSNSGSGQDNLQFWQRSWFMWLCLFLFPPIGIIICYINRERHSKWKIICGVFAILFLVGFFVPKSERNSTQQASTNIETQQTKSTSNVSTKVHTDLATFPENIDGIRAYVISAIDEKYKSKTDVDIAPSTNTPGGYLVEVTINSNDLDLEYSKNMARNVIVATYDAVYEKNLPVIYVSYQTRPEQGNRVFILGIGKNVASKVDRDKWNLHSGNTAFSTEEIISFARKNQEQAITADGKTHFENRCFMK